MGAGGVVVLDVGDVVEVVPEAFEFGRESEDEFCLGRRELAKRG